MLILIVKFVAYLLDATFYFAGFQDVHLLLNLFCFSLIVFVYMILHFGNDTAATLSQNCYLVTTSA